MSKQNCTFFHSYCQMFLYNFWLLLVGRRWVTVVDIKTRVRKEEEKEKGNEGGQCPQSQIKALSLPTASAFESPCQDRKSSHVTAVSQCHRSERESASSRETGRVRERDRKTDGEGENGTMPQTEGSQAFIDGQEKNNSSRFNWKRKPCGLDDLQLYLSVFSQEQKHFKISFPTVASKSK